MKRHALFVWLLIIGHWSFAQAPSLINYQGRLITGTNLFNGNVGLSLRLFNVPSGGSSIYEDSNSVTVADGLYSTFVGDNTVSGSLTNALTNANVYVEVVVNGVALTPRERIGSVPYALNVNAAGIAGTIPDSQLSTNVALRSVPNTATQATGVPTVSFGFVVNATVTFGGSGYVSPPAVVVNDGSGVGAIIVASISGGAVTGLAVQAPGSGYTTNATLTIGPPPSNAYQTFGGVNYFTGVNTMTNGSNTFAGSFAGSFSGTFSGPGILPWQTVAGTNVQAQSNAGYLLTNDALVTVTLPASPNPGDIVRISGAGAAGWKTAQNAGQFVALPGDFGDFWTPHESNRYWAAVASSADGAKLLAADGGSGTGGLLYVSADAGASWTPRQSNQLWTCVASSADGAKLIAGGFLIQLFTSVDTGATWTARETGRRWASIASSADGTKLVAAYGDNLGGGFITSSDSGATWSNRIVAFNCIAVASSSDGSKLLGAINGGQLFTSTDSGTNWIPRESSRAWRALASSTNGDKLVAVTTGQVFTSTDSGTNWTARDSGRSWISVASSADGNELVAAVSGGQIFTSTDAGATWIARESTRSWRSVASSSDASRLAAVDITPGRIYTFASKSMAGTAGYLLGGQKSAIELQYIGNGQFIPLSHEGTILAY